MITFWGVLNEEEISSYAGTLILPSFMAHLERLPFRFEMQSNSDGCRPLTVFYTGEGRFEEFSIPPEEHALPLLRSVCPTLDEKRIRLNPDETLWRWSADFDATGEDEQATLMRIYFDPAVLTLPSDRFMRFEPEQCYASVTRGEVFVGEVVLRSFFNAWLDFLSEKDDSEKGLTDIEPIAGGFTFRNRRFGGEFVLQNDETFAALLRFCGLSKSLDDLATVVRLDLDDPDTAISQDGLRFRLVKTSDD